MSGSGAGDAAPALLLPLLSPPLALILLPRQLLLVMMVVRATSVLCACVSARAGAKGGVGFGVGFVGCFALAHALETVCVTKSSSGHKDGMGSWSQHKSMRASACAPRFKALPPPRRRLRRRRRHTRARILRHQSLIQLPERARHVRHDRLALRVEQPARHLDVVVRKA